MEISRFEEARNEKGWKQTRAARETGVTRETWNRWENGRTQPNPQQLRSLSTVFGKPMEWFTAAGDAGQGDSVVTVSPTEGDSGRILSMLERQQALMAEQQANFTALLQEQQGLMERQRQDMAELTRIIANQQNAHLQEREFAQRLAVKREEKIEQLELNVNRLTGKVNDLEKQLRRGRQQSLEPPAGPGLAGEG